MEVRKDFAKRTTAIARSTPREVIGNLLKSMLPREPVRTRSPEAQHAVDWRGWRVPEGSKEAVSTKPERDPFASRMATRRRKVRNRPYEVINTRLRSRRGTKRHSQLEIVIAHTNTRDAMRAGAESVDITFAESEGYIKFTD